MIATQHDAGSRDADAIRDSVDEIPECGRLHAGIAAVLVDLVRSGLDAGEVFAQLLRVNQCSLDRDRVRRADGIDSGALAGAIAGNSVENRFHRIGAGALCPSSASDSSSAATSASASATSFSAPGTTPTTTSEMTAVMRGAPAFVSGETTRALP